MNVKLVVVQGKPEGKEIPLRTAKFLIGRGAECHLKPNSELISRHHCLFIVGELGVTLRDLGSMNGTRVNGERISGEVALSHDDLVEVGPLGFRMEVEPAPVAVEPKEEVGEDVVRRAAAVTVPAKAGVNGSQTAAGAPCLVADPASPVQQPDDAEVDTVRVKTSKSAPAPVGERAEEETDPQGDAFAGSSEQLVKLESGRKMKIGNAKANIGKTREDTCNEAAEILRRIMERRSRP